MSDSTAVPLYAFSCTLILLGVSLYANFWLIFTNGKPASKEQFIDHLRTRGQTLPSGWLTDEIRFQTERRAILSQTWICVSHRSRLIGAGDYVALQAAGFQVLLMLGKDGVIRSFHNVCRHRAFPVARKASGTAIVLGCRYHGWSYNTKGELHKAPDFDNLPGFDKSQFSLFPIHTKIDEGGFIHINLSGDKQAANTEVPAVRRFGKPTRISQTSTFLDSWELKGKFNWKLALINNDLQDGENGGEITSVFSSSRLTPVGRLQFGLLTTVYTKSGTPYWYQISYSPGSVDQTTVRCDVYAVKKIDSKVFEDNFKRGLEKEMQQRVQCHEQAQKTPLESWSRLDHGKLPHFLPHGDYVLIKFKLGDQSEIASMVDAHLQREIIRGTEINPASAEQCKSTSFQQADNLCRALECGDRNQQLVW